MSQLSDLKSVRNRANPSQPEFLQKSASWSYSFWKFSRPHTIVGTSFERRRLIRYCGSTNLGDRHGRELDATVGDSRCLLVR